MQQQIIVNSATNNAECSNKYWGMQQKTNGKQQQIIGHAVINNEKCSDK